MYAFFMRGGDITRIADIFRLGRTERGVLKGFQRKKIQNHVRDIAQYLDKMDVRLDSPQSGINGTTADFPHRALRHFAGLLASVPANQKVQEHQVLVEQALRHLKPYVRTRGATASDEEVLAVISRLWKKCDGSRTRVLRELRAHSGVACEQSRFRKLADRYEAALS